MIPMSKYALMVGTVAAAIGIGFFMQNSPTAQARYGNPVQVASLSPDLTGTTLTDIATDVSLVSDAIADPEEDGQNPGAARSVPGPRPDVEQMADPLPAAPDATQAHPQHPPADDRAGPAGRGEVAGTLCFFAPKGAAVHPAQGNALGWMNGWAFGPTAREPERIVVRFTHPTKSLTSPPAPRRRRS